MATPQDAGELLEVYRKEADFLKEVLSLSTGQNVLDVGCGAGEHCLAFMRSFRPQLRFDAVFTSSGTFGIFDDAGNRAVLQIISDVLADEGEFLIGPGNLQLLEQESFRRKDWTLVGDGCLLMERNWNRSTSSFRETLLFIDARGTIIELDNEGESKGEYGKVYSLNQLKEMIEGAGLVFKAAYGSFELPPEPYKPDSPRLLIVGARKKADV